MMKVVITGAALGALVLVAGWGTGHAQNQQADREELYCSYPRGGLAPDVGPYPCTRKPHYVGVRRLTTFCYGDKCEELVNFGVPPTAEPSAAPAPGAPRLSLVEQVRATVEQQAP